MPDAGQRAGQRIGEQDDKVLIVEASVAEVQGEGDEVGLQCSAIVNAVGLARGRHSALKQTAAQVESARTMKEVLEKAALSMKTARSMPGCSIAC